MPPVIKLVSKLNEYQPRIGAFRHVDVKYQHSYCCKYNARLTQRAMLGGALTHNGVTFTVGFERSYMSNDKNSERRAALRTIKAEYSLCWITDNGGSNYIVRYIQDGANKTDLVPKIDVTSIAYMTE